MRLSNFLVVTFGIGVLSYPAIQLPSGKPFFAEGKGGKQAEPVPRPDRPKTDFALVQPILAEPAIPAEKEIRIIINVPATKLTLLNNGEVVKEYPIAVGQAIYKTPLGKQEIKELIWNPWWHPPDSEWAKNEKVTPPGPKNPLGPVKMLLGDEIRMHGTTKDRSIGSAASHGCIRMHSPDARDLAWYLQTQLTGKTDPALLEKYAKNYGTSVHVKLDRPVPVNIVYDPVAFLGDSVIIYPDIYGRVKDLRGDVAWELFSNGVDPLAFDLASLQKPVKKANAIELEKLKK